MSPQVDVVIEGTNTPLGSGDSTEVLNEEDDAHAEQRERIKVIITSYDDTDSQESRISSESKD